MKFEQGPQMSSPEKEVGGIENLREVRKSLQEVKQIIDSQIDELARKLSRVIALAEEGSIKKGNQGEVIKEILESQKIMDEVGQLKEGAKRLQALIDQLDSSK